MPDCIFCKIGSGDIPSFTVYEDDQIRAFLDIAPSSKGHTLLIPKQHADDLLSIDGDVLAKLNLQAQKLASMYKDVLHADGFNLHNNSGEAAGQEVMHFHLHLIPRYINDGLSFGGPTGNPEAIDVEAVHKTLTA